MNQPPIQVIPTGVSGVKTGQDWWRLISEGAKISKQYERKINKTLPAPRERK